jgi:hypothetical protein
MKPHHLVLALSLAGLVTAAGAYAETVVLGGTSAVRPDGGTQTWFPHDNHTEIRQRDGATASVDREGKITDWKAAPSCGTAGPANPAGGQRECRKGADGKVRSYVVHYVSYTCTNPPSPRRLVTAFVETAAGTPCTEEDYARDMKAASSTWGETWTTPGLTAQKKKGGEKKEKKVAKKAPGKQPTGGGDGAGGGTPQINIGIGFGGGGGDRGRREREHRRERETGTFGR